VYLSILAMDSRHNHWGWVDGRLVLHTILEFILRAISANGREPVDGRTEMAEYRCS